MKPLLMMIMFMRNLSKLPAFNCVCMIDLLNILDDFTFGLE